MTAEQLNELYSKHPITGLRVSGRKIIIEFGETETVAVTPEISWDVAFFEIESKADIAEKEAARAVMIEKTAKRKALIDTLTPEQKQLFQ